MPITPPALQGWGEPSAPATTVDNGTAAWGKPMDTGTSWGEPVGDAGGTSGWGNASLGQQPPNKPGECSQPASEGGIPLCKLHVPQGCLPCSRHRAVWWSCYWNVHCRVFSPPGPKSMQDSWCGDDMPLTGSRQTSWEEEEDVEIGMWNSSSSQEANPSLNWPPYLKKMPTKVRSSSGQGLLSFLKAKSEGITALTHYT